ncbi:MAG: hypothetical protein ACYTFQ_18920 [Planctomycetota bacterium]
MDKAGDLRARREYEQTAHEIGKRSQDGLFPGPDNAALLYYQAFLLRPEPDMATRLEIDKVLKGAKPTERIRTYLGHCLSMIRTAEAASRIPRCEWGIWHNYGFGVNTLGVQARHLKFILAVDARTLVADGHYRPALARCLTMRRLARHIGDDTMFSHLASRSSDVFTLDTIHHVLDTMPLETDTLTWLRGRLATMPGAAMSIAKPLQNNFESILQSVRTDRNALEKIRSALAQVDKDNQSSTSARDLTDEELLAHMGEPYRRFLNTVLQAADSDAPYEHKRDEIRRLTDELTGEHRNDPAVSYLILMCGTSRLLEWYDLQAGYEAQVNAIKAAVEVYLVLAKTGKLPDRIPDHLPKDPFTGRDFGYQITDEGFALRCQAKDFLQRWKNVLEFKVRR